MEDEILKNSIYDTRPNHNNLSNNHNHDIPNTNMSESTRHNIRMATQNWPIQSELPKRIMIGDKALYKMLMKAYQRRIKKIEQKVHDHHTRRQEIIKATRKLLPYVNIHDTVTGKKITNEDIQQMEINDIIQIVDEMVETINGNYKFTEDERS